MLFRSSSKTKAFKYFNNGENKTFKQFIKAIEETKLFNSERTEVIALILLNYTLNGSYPQFGGYLMSRGLGILTNNINSRTMGLLAFNKALKPKTYNKWLNALNEYRDYISEGELTDYMNDRMSNYNKPEITVIDNNLVKVIIETKSPEYKELTIKQIESLLGYKIRIVG